ncbi:MAG TPA: hypothetical protein H9889_08660, partial [Candidatus Ignatzschineria merdigallinarum]|nr:hypothetical protein [Candidatus Ignatzschineria merdigallinarum]
IAAILKRNNYKIKIKRKSVIVQAITLFCWRYLFRSHGELKRKSAITRHLLGLRVNIQKLTVVLETVSA